MYESDLVCLAKMFRFSCFNSHILSHKPKKVDQITTEAMQKVREDCPGEQGLKNFVNSRNQNSPELKVREDTMYSYVDNESDDVVPRNIRKSMSLGSRMNFQARDQNSGCNSEEEIDQVYSFDGSIGGTGSEPKIQERSVLSSNMVNNGSIFPIGEKEGSKNYGSSSQISGNTHISVEVGKPRASPVMVKSNSLPNISLHGNSISTYLFQRSRSCNDLNVALVLRQKDILDDTYNYVGSAKDWIIPAMYDMNPIQTPDGESEIAGKDFKVKRIEDWVMDLQHCGSNSFEETDEWSDLNEYQAGSSDRVIDSFTVVKMDSGKVIPGTEVVKKYLSSLSASATSAQLANHGLVAIPFLSAFVSLRALNISGNAVVRITAGALPRGLHVLNLSKNSISTIEGLRELTRLRVLDLSYNRIVRIGHGLASCSALKELYLAGNKISEVEGLHRLLKLNVLDLRFNKISTTKCLGQLAANYNSLQAISLEGNPAHKNVGEDQLKKYLLGLLPHLVYLNRQSLKAGSTLKDSTDRSTRLGIGSSRSELKSMRKASHSGGGHKGSGSSSHGRRSRGVAPMATKAISGRYTRLPPTVTSKPPSIRANFYDVNLSVLRPDFAIRRSRSESNIGVV